MKPTNYDQDLTNADKEFMRLRGLVKTIPKKKLKGKVNPFFKGQREDRRGMTKKLSKEPKFIQGARESDAQFENRIHLAAQRAIASAQFQEEFNVELDDKGSAIKERSKRAEKNTKRLQEKKQKKKKKVEEKKNEKEMEFSRFEDKVEFGETVMAPPQLSAKPRKAPSSDKKPGHRSLLLKQVISENETTQQKIGHAARNVGKVKKRKHMSPFEQITMDKEREKAIQMYRNMKATNLQKGKS